MKTPRLVARYANVCNLVAFCGYEEWPRKFNVLRRHCEAGQRPYHEIQETDRARFAPGWQGR